MRTLVEDYDIVVVGAGHAGCEAALAGARLGLNTVMFTVSVDSIALMPFHRPGHQALLPDGLWNCHLRSGYMALMRYCLHLQ